MAHEKPLATPLMKKPEKPKPLVVAVISTDYAAARTELRGVTDTARRLGWSLETIDIYFLGRDYAKYGSVLARADGVIARHADSLADAALGALGIPLVSLDTSWKPGMGSRPWASVVCDNRAVAETAAEELLATGRRHFAVVPVLKPQNWTKPREQAFLARIRASGCEARRYSPRTDWDWGAERAELARWLSRFPRPFGIFAPNDRLAKFTLEACQAAGLEVPRDAAIVGADNDETHCLSVRPNISSVRIDFEGAGRLAAETLRRLMEEGAAKRPRRPLMESYGVLGVARRASSRVGPAPAVDPRLRDGLDYIAHRFGDPYMGIRDVARAMDVCPRQAERIFAATGKSIRLHIEEKRLANVRELLATTDIPVGEVARRCGFASDTYFSQFVKDRLGLSPSAWRQASAPSSNFQTQKPEMAR